MVGEEWSEPSLGRTPGRSLVGRRELQTRELPRATESWIHYAEANAWCHANHHYIAGVLLSDDEGRTFRLSGYINGGREHHLMEPQVVELADGRVAMLLRSMSEGVLLRSDSSDGGVTWSPPVRTEIPNPSAKVNVLRHSDGRIFLLHNPNGDTSNSMQARNPLSVWVSHDNMRTWPIREDLVIRAAGSHGLNYPSGYLDEEADLLRFVWEDSHSLFLADFPLALGERSETCSVPALAEHP